MRKYRLIAEKRMIKQPKKHEKTKSSKPFESITVFIALGFKEKISDQDHENPADKHQGSSRR